MGKCLIHREEESTAVGWVLHTSVEDARHHMKSLTDREIDYCLHREYRVTVLKMLKAEWRKRTRARS